MVDAWRRRTADGASALGLHDRRSALLTAAVLVLAIGLYAWTAQTSDLGPTHGATDAYNLLGDAFRPERGVREWAILGSNQ